MSNQRNIFDRIKERHSCKNPAMASQPQGWDQRGIVTCKFCNDLFFSDIPALETHLNKFHQIDNHRITNYFQFDSSVTFTRPGAELVEQYLKQRTSQLSDPIKKSVSVKRRHPGEQAICAPVPKKKVKNAQSPVAQDLKHTESVPVLQKKVKKVLSSDTQVLTPTDPASERTCGICFKEYFDHSTLKRHLRNIHGRKINPEPAKKFISKKKPGKSLRGKKRKQSQNQSLATVGSEYKIAHSGIPSASSDSAQTYGNHADHDLSKTCHICQKEYFDKYTLRRHLKNVHDIHNDGVETAPKDNLKENVPTPAKSPVTLQNQSIIALCPLGVDDPSRRCPICLRIYSNKSTLNQHLVNIHHAVCEVTPPKPSVRKKVKSDKTVAAHLPENAGISAGTPSVTSVKDVQMKSPARICYICSKEYFDKSTLNRHLRNVHGINDEAMTFSSTPSGQKTGTPAASSIKDALMKSPARICNICSKEYFDKSTLNKHVRKVHGISNISKTPPSILSPGKKAQSSSGTPISSSSKDMKSPTRICHICCKEYFDKSTLNKHLRKVHGISNISKTPPSILSPGKKAQSSSGTPTAASIKDVLKSPTRSCNICNKEYFDKSTLNRHLRNVHGIKDEAMTFSSTPSGKKASAARSCNICHKEFFDKSNLNRHQRTVHRVKNVAALPSFVKKEDAEKKDSSQRKSKTTLLASVKKFISKKKSAKDFHKKQRTVAAKTSKKGKCTKMLCRKFYVDPVKLKRHMGKFHDLPKDSLATSVPAMTEPASPDKHGKAKRKATKASSLEAKPTSVIPLLETEDTSQKQKGITCFKELPRNNALNHDNRCIFCKKRFCDTAGVNKHLRKIHEIQNRTEAAKISRYHICSVCQKVMTTEWEVQLHEKSLDCQIKKKRLKRDRSRAAKADSQTGKTDKVGSEDQEFCDEESMSVDTDLDGKPGGLCDKTSGTKCEMLQDNGSEGQDGEDPAVALDSEAQTWAKSVSDDEGPLYGFDSEGQKGSVADEEDLSDVWKSNEGDGVSGDGGLTDGSNSGEQSSSVTDSKGLLEGLDSEEQNRCVSDGGSPLDDSEEQKGSVTDDESPPDVLDSEEQNGSDADDEGLPDYLGSEEPSESACSRDNTSESDQSLPNSDITEVDREDQDIFKIEAEDAADIVTEEDQGLPHMTHGTYDDTDKDILTEDNHDQMTCKVEDDDIQMEDHQDPPQMQSDDTEYEGVTNILVENNHDPRKMNLTDAVDKCHKEIQASPQMIHESGEILTEAQRDSPHLPHEETANKYGQEQNQDQQEVWHDSIESTNNPSHVTELQKRMEDFPKQECDSERNVSQFEGLHTSIRDRTEPESFNLEEHDRMTENVPEKLKDEEDNENQICGEKYFGGGKSMLSGIVLMEGRYTRIPERDNDHYVKDDEDKEKQTCGESFPGCVENIVGVSTLVEEEYTKTLKSDNVDNHKEDGDQSCGEEYPEGDEDMSGVCKAVEEYTRILESGTVDMIKDDEENENHICSEDHLRGGGDMSGVSTGIEEKYPRTPASDHDDEKENQIISEIYPGAGGDMSHAIKGMEESQEIDANIVALMDQMLSEKAYSPLKFNFTNTVPRGLSQEGELTTDRRNGHFLLLSRRVPHDNQPSSSGSGQHF